MSPSIKANQLNKYSSSTTSCASMKANKVNDHSSLSPSMKANRVNEYSSSSPSMKANGVNQHSTLAPSMKANRVNEYSSLSPSIKTNRVNKRALLLLTAFSGFDLVDAISFGFLDSAMASSAPHTEEEASLVQLKMNKCSDEQSPGVCTRWQSFVSSLSLQSLLSCLGLSGICCWCVPNTVNREEVTKAAVSDVDNAIEQIVDEKDQILVDNHRLDEDDPILFDRPGHGPASGNKFNEVKEGKLKESLPYTGHPPVSGNPEVIPDAVDNAIKEMEHALVDKKATKHDWLSQDVKAKLTKQVQLLPKQGSQSQAEFLQLFRTLSLDVVDRFEVEGEKHIIDINDVVSLMLASNFKDKFTGDNIGNDIVTLPEQIAKQLRERYGLTNAPTNTV